MSVFTKLLARKASPKVEKHEAKETNQTEVQVKIPKKKNEDLVGKLKPPEHLFHLLSSQVSALSFYKYVNKKFSSETLSFWVSVEHYKCKVAENKGVAIPYAKEIYDTYLKRFSEKEVNLEGEQHSICLQNPDINTFDDLQHIAWQLLVNADYQKFVTSPDYQDYLRKLFFNGIHLNPLKVWKK